MPLAPDIPVPSSGCSGAFRFPAPLGSSPALLPPRTVHRRPSSHPSYPSLQAKPGVHPLRRAARRVLIAAAVAPAAWLRGVMQHAKAHDWNLVTDMLFTGTMPQGWTGDGVLALLPYQPETLAGLRLSGVPCVAWGETSAPAVSLDHHAVGALAAAHLLERAHRSFAWAPLVDDQANRQCLDGYRARLADHGCTCIALPPVYRSAEGQWQDNWAGQRAALIARLQQLPRPTAVFAFNDGVALDVIDAAREAGLTVPDDLAVLGVGDSVACAASAVPLSSIDVDLEAIGLRAAALLDDAMRGECAPAIVRVRPRGVVTRLSTDVTAVANARVARALAFIADNYHDPMLSVGVVAEAIGMSRRQLERSVRQETGSTVNEHIVRTRMSEASRLLRHHPRARSADIAALVGLTGPGTFFRTFRRFFGMSPGAHRDWAARASVVEASRATASPVASVPPLGTRPSAA